MSYDALNNLGHPVVMGHPVMIPYQLIFSPSAPDTVGHVMKCLYLRTSLLRMHDDHACVPPPMAGDHTIRRL